MYHLKPGGRCRVEIRGSEKRNETEHASLFEGRFRELVRCAKQILGTGTDKYYGTGGRDCTDGSEGKVGLASSSHPTHNEGCAGV